MKCRSACKQDSYTGGRHDKSGACASEGNKALLRGTAGLAAKAHLWCSNVIFNSK